MRSTCFVSVATLILIISLPFGSADGQSTNKSASSNPWTQFRGQSGTGQANVAAKPAVNIDLEKQTRWATDIPGTGWSSPVYSNNLIWMTTAVTKAADPGAVDAKLKDDPLKGIKTLAGSVELRALAIDRESGKLIHNRLLRTIEDPEPINPMNSYASPTPAIAQGRVVCHFGSYGTWCLDAESGESLWDTRYVIDHSVGPGSSPIIIDRNIILVCDGTDQQFVVAVDLESGKEVWKTQRPPMRAANGEQRKAYATPVLIEVGGKPQLVIPTAQWIAAYRPDDGKEIWRLDHGDGFSVTPMVAFDSGLVMFSTGFMRPEFVAVDPSGTGDVSQSHLRWRARGAPTMPSFVVSSGHLYSISDKGILVCIDVKTGEIVGRERIGGNFSSSPLLAAGNLYLCDREGKMTVVACSPNLKVIASNQFDGSIMASPVLIGDDMLIRTEKQLLRIHP